LNNPTEIEYQKKYYKAAPNIAELAGKMQTKNPSETEIMLHGLYAIILMRLRKQELTSETQAAIETFSSLLALLSKKYHEREKKERTEWM
jgi:flagellin-specific chaperone FliS